MKKIILSLMAGMVLFTSCDLLYNEPNEIPTIDNYFTSETNVELYTNYFYAEFAAYGTGGASGDFYFNTLNDDQAVKALKAWNFKNVPATDGTWSACYTEIRRANILLEKIDDVPDLQLPEKEANKKHWIGLARLYRGWQHYCLVRKFGDVQWLDHTLTADSTETLMAARDSRNYVMDKVLEDLNFAVANISKNKTSRTAYNVYVANAMKTEICLFEGTYSKYHKNDAARAEKFLKEAKTAAEVIIKSGQYTLSPGAEGYRAIYNSLDLSPNKEMILYKKYVLGTLYHATQDYCCGSTITNGMSKAAFNSYLMADGKLPDGNDKGKYVHLKTWNDTLKSVLTGKKDSVVIRHKGYMDISEVLAARDPRLAQQVDADLRFVGCGRVRYEGMPGQEGAAENTSSTGYGVLKFDEPNTVAKNRQSTNGNETDGPIFWLGLILINHAEACAELGLDAEAIASLNQLRARAGMPNYTPLNDPANTIGVSDLIWEIRRERRVELMYDKNDRYWSLIRWHQLDKLDTEKYPEQTLGAWIDMSDERMVSQVDKKNVTVNADGYIDCSINTKGELVTRVFDEKHYLAPIPSGQISLNPNLTQNPGW
jgi:hypothetical protein